MKVKVKLNLKNIAATEKDIEYALIETGEAIKDDLQQSQTMPFDTGALQNRSTFVDDSKSASGKVTIVSDEPYARRLYFHPEYKFRKDDNPNAGGLWFEPYISGVKSDFAKNAFTRLLKVRARK